MSRSRHGRRFLAPEIVQTSSMDCGPAALKSLLDGFGIPLGYGQLRDACQTDVDGTSIDTLEDIARRAGLNAEQVLVPIDHVLLDRSSYLPSIAAARNAAGTTHFIVLWRRLGNWVQVMDPARGRLWLRQPTLQRQLVLHSMSVPLSDWVAWSRTSDFCTPLRQRLITAGMTGSRAEQAIAHAAEDMTGSTMMRLDAATRMVQSLQKARVIPRSAMTRALAELVDAAAGVLDPTQVIPESYWSALADRRSANHVIVRGAVMVRIKGRSDAPQTSATEPAPMLAPALSGSSTDSLRTMWHAIVGDWGAASVGLFCALVASALGGVAEAILLRSAVDVQQTVQGPGQVLWAGWALVAFSSLLLALELFRAAGERRLGRTLEGRLRIAFLEKLPKLSDSYFLSRPVADTLERSHMLHLLRTLPRLGSRFVRIVLELVATATALVWFSPESTTLVIGAVACGAFIPLLGHVLIAERDLRTRTHTGALATYHLDALRGRTAIEAHGAIQALESEHEMRLADWAGAAVSLQRASLLLEGLQMSTGFGFAAWMFLARAGTGGTSLMLLQAYWMLALPTLGYELALIAREYPSLRSTLVRVLEPLSVSDPHRRAPHAASPPRPVALSLRNVSLRLTGRTVLDGLSVEIEAGEHVAIVGPSGAGKSTLVGLLLGWTRTTDGALLVDGVSLDESRMLALRQTTAWVDPTIQLWNRSLLENLLYGTDGDMDDLAAVLEGAGLLPVLSRLPDGLATPLGESGTLLSGGEGQRVRFARALLKRNPALVVLDEPFVGLERDRRRSLLAFARQRWSRTTMLYVTHDLPEARGFDRILVMERGRVVEDGDPRVLANSPSSRYRRMLQAHDAAQGRLNSADWRHITIDAGRIVHEHVRSSGQTA